MLPGSFYVLKADVTFEVEKAASTVTTAPAAQKLTYTGEDQHLVTAGSTSDGELVYSLEKEGTYTPAIPTGKAAQEYTVWYKVKGDANHKDSRACKCDGNNQLPCDRCGSDTGRDQ